MLFVVRKNDSDIINYIYAGLFIERLYLLNKKKSKLCHWLDFTFCKFN